MTLTRLAAVLLMMAAPLVGQDAKPKDLTANLCVRGKLVFSDDCAGPIVGNDWKISKGKWEIADKSLKGSELAADMHSAVLKHNIPSKNLVLQFSFKFEGATGLTAAFDAKDHVCRVQISPKDFQLRRDVAKDSGDKAPKLGKVKTALGDGWHTMLIEIQGREMLAQVDDKVFVFGENEGIDADKSILGFHTEGDSIRIKDVRLWDATPNPDWATAKAKLPMGK